MLAWLLACSGGPPEDLAATAAADVNGAANVVPADADGLGWVSRVAYEPAAFAELTAKSREGWVAFHANDLPGAVAKFDQDPVGRARASFALAVLYDDLSRVSGIAAEGLFSEWSAKGGLPAGNDAPMVAALAGACTGGETAGLWASKVAGGPDAPIAQAMAQGRSPTDVEAAGPYGKRMALHRQARASGNPEALLAAAAAPVVTVSERTFEREFWDPCVYRTLSQLWVDRGARDLGGNGWRSASSFTRAGLAGSFLAAWTSGPDLEAELASAEAGATASWLGLLGARAPTIRRLGLGAASSPSDDPEAAKAEVQSLDAALDAWGKKILDQAPEEGRAVVADLALLKRFRQEWLAARARLALTRKHARTALTFVELARDHASPGIGPANGASLYAIAAEAQLRLGHTREALDLLHVVTAAHPEARGIEETAGDLAVLQGLARHGDSKEDL